jgi:integrase
MACGRNCVPGPEVRDVFLNAITPGHSTNPFAPRHQARNYALWLSYYDCGLRRSEAIGLKTKDLELNGKEPMITVHRRPDDPDDTRTVPANTKSARRWC